MTTSRPYLPLTADQLEARITEGLKDPPVINPTDEQLAAAARILAGLGPGSTSSDSTSSPRSSRPTSCSTQNTRTGARLG